MRQNTLLVALSPFRSTSQVTMHSIRTPITLFQCFTTRRHFILSWSRSGTSHTFNKVLCLSLLSTFFTSGNDLTFIIRVFPAKLSSLSLETRFLLAARCKCVFFSFFYLATSLFSISTSLQAVMSMLHPISSLKSMVITSMVQQRSSLQPLTIATMQWRFCCRMERMCFSRIGMEKVQYTELVGAEMKRSWTS